jgi:hypothetical protein
MLINFSIKVVSQLELNTVTKYIIAIRSKNATRNVSLGRFFILLNGDISYCLSNWNHFHALNAKYLINNCEYDLS